MEEIRQAIFNLNTNSSPWPGGFGGFFFPTILFIHDDVCNASLEFFTSGMVPPHYNANNVVLISKSSNRDTLPRFRPIVMANFKFKIISKVLVDKLVLILPGIISEEQRGFIHKGQIKDYSFITSEAINLVHYKYFITILLSLQRLSICSQN